MKRCRTLKRIEQLQSCLVKMNVIDGVMPLLGSANEDIVREALLLYSSLLFNANRTTQVFALSYSLTGVRRLLSFNDPESSARNLTTDDYMKKSGGSILCGHQF